MKDGHQPVNRVHSFPIRIFAALAAAETILLRSERCQYDSANVLKIPKTGRYQGKTPLAGTSRDPCIRRADRPSCGIALRHYVGPVLTRIRVRVQGGEELRWLIRSSTRAAPQLLRRGHNINSAWVMNEMGRWWPEVDEKHFP